jgi:hypothetical protein
MQVSSTSESVANDAQATTGGRCGVKATGAFCAWVWVNKPNSVLEGLATCTSGPHVSLLLESRFDLVQFAARVMMDAVTKLSSLGYGAHPYPLTMPVN